MPSFHDLGNATANCANSSESLSKSNVLISGPFDNSVCAKSAQPFVVLGTHIDSLPAILTAADPDFKTPEPFGLMFISTFVSPVDDKTGPSPVAALAIVNSLTAELVAVRLINSFPFVSEIFVPIAGLVKVLFVKVCVPVRVTSPSPKPKV